MRECSAPGARETAAAMTDEQGTTDAGAPSSSQAVAEQIRRFVLDARLQPGDRLGREADLARERPGSRPRADGTVEHPSKA